MAEAKKRPAEKLAGEGSFLHKLLGIRKKKKKRLEEIQAETLKISRK